MIKWRQEAILDVYNAFAAAFLFVSPWLFAYTHGTLATDAWVSSALIVLVSGAALIAFAAWKEVLTLLIGIWLVMAPWVIGFEYRAAMKVSIGVGMVVAYLSALELWLARYGSSSVPSH